jgi:hypothetical protein
VKEELLLLISLSRMDASRVHLETTFATVMVGKRMLELLIISLRLLVEPDLAVKTLV